jgi:hypothetical protein
MRQESFNPANNNLPSSADESELIKSIEMSGYPLQGIVSSKLKDHFGVTEEWGYIDSDTKEHRSLDVFAYKALFDNKGAATQPSIALLIECKRSIHPYVFFKIVTDRSIPQFPRVVGLPNEDVELGQLNAGKFRDIPVSAVLGLNKHPFIDSGPPRCAAFTQATLSGKKINLSGSDPFNNIVLPLVKATKHITKLYKIEHNAQRLFPTLSLCISVLDAPMVLVESPDKTSDPVLTPWVRVVRLEANPDQKRFLPYHFYVIDVVHIDYFDEVIYKQLMPFAEEFSKRAIALGSILSKGGVVENLDDWTWDQIKKKAT